MSVSYKIIIRAYVTTASLRGKICSLEERENRAPNYQMDCTHRDNLVSSVPRGAEFLFQPFLDSD